MVSEIEVLLVEDDPNDAELTLRALRTSVPRERVLHAGDGVEALAVLFGEGGLAAQADFKAPRMILLDLKLPRMDGHEVLRRVKEDARTRKIPVVVLTSSKEDCDINESYRLGVNSYLVKPVGFDEYVALVGDAGRYWMSLNQPALDKAA